MVAATPHGELPFSLFGGRVQFERQLNPEPVITGDAAAKRRGRRGGRPPTIGGEQLEQITAALDGGASTASVCRSVKIARSTLIDTLERIRWQRPAK